MNKKNIGASLFSVLFLVLSVSGSVFAADPKLNVNMDLPAITPYTFPAASPKLSVMGLFDMSEAFLNRAVAIIVSLAIVWFIWNVFQYVIAADEAKKADAKKYMVWGIVAIFVMVSIWGLVAILQSTFGTSGVTTTIGNQLPL